MTSPEVALYARLSTAEFTDLLAVDPEDNAPRLENGWPEDALEQPHAADWPRATFIFSTAEPLADGVVRYAGQLDLWVWPSGAVEAGRAHLDTIEAKALTLLNGTWWITDGTRISSVVPVTVDDPGGADSPHHRTIRLDLLLSEE